MSKGLIGMVEYRSKHGGEVKSGWGRDVRHRSGRSHEVICFVVVYYTDLRMFGRSCLGTNGLSGQTVVLLTWRDVSLGGFRSDLITVRL